jgi:tRNA pseudouridine13 synthase
MQFFLTHSPIDAYFKQSKDDFVVTEIPLYEFSGDGEHLIIKFRKKDLSTWDAVQIFSEQLGCKSRDIGYAGLKDKNAMTIQHISVPKNTKEKVEKFEHKNIKILETINHNNKIRVGHLKGNRFFIRLKRVNHLDAKKIESALQTIAQIGMPNYFGYQRFGINGDNYIKGKELLEGKIVEKNRKLKQMYQNAYQSYLFNLWLSKRIELSHLINSFKPNELKDNLPLDLDELKELKSQPHFFKILKGEMMGHYPYGKIFKIYELEEEALKFYQKDRVPTGILPGKRANISDSSAYLYEKEFDIKLPLDGTRRYAWIFPDEIESDYKEEQNWMELSFTLPKGSYATVLVEELLKTRDFI